MYITSKWTVVLFCKKNVKFKHFHYWSQTVVLYKSPAEYRALTCVPSVGYERVKNTGWPFSGSQLLPAVPMLQMSDMALNHTEQISHQKQQTSDTGAKLTVVSELRENARNLFYKKTELHTFCLGVKMYYNKRYLVTTTKKLNFLSVLQTLFKSGEC